MTLAVYTFDMLSGQRLTPVPVTKASWKLTTNADEDLSCTIPARAPEVRKLRVWDATSLAVCGLLMEVDGLPVAAGPIWKRKYSPKAGTIELTAGGLRSYFERRLLLPASARGHSLVDANGDPVSTYDSVLAADDPGGIVQEAIQLVRLWPNGSIPMDLGADRTAGTASTRTVNATDLKTVESLIDDMVGLENGPDIAFRARKTPDGTGVYWEYQAGTTAQPRLGANDPAGVKFRYGGMGAGLSDLVIEEDGTDLTSDAWQKAGSASDNVLSAESYDTRLLTAGYPLLQSADSSHTDVTVQATLQAYANQDTKLGRYAYSQWTATSRARMYNDQGGRAIPTLSAGDYWLGDMATVTIDRDDPVFGDGFNDYSVTRRIAALSGDEKDLAYPITFAEDVVLV